GARARPRHRPRLHRGDGRRAHPLGHAGRRAHHDRHHPGRAVTRVLLVDDDRHLLRALRVNLTARGYQVHTAADATAGLAAASRQPPDLAIVDLGLPDMDGLRVVEGLRGWTTVPIIVLSARHAEAAKVAALDAGADDYVIKPFGMDELLA